MIGPTFISTPSLADEVRRSITRIQNQVVDAQKELTSGRHADIGVALGAKTGRVVQLRNETQQYQSILDSNGIASTRLKVSQAGLQSISDSAQLINAALVRARSNSSSPETIVQEARSTLGSLIDTLNTSVDGQYIFSGLNSDARPLQNYFADVPPASRQAVTAAYQLKFGFLPTDPAASSISAADMQNYLDNEYAAQFSPASWAGAWSEASDKNIRNRVSRTELIETSTNANDDAFRKLTSALALVADSGFSNLNEATQNVVLDKAILQVSEALQGVSRLQSQLGVTQQRISASNDQIELQKSFLTLAVGELEDVDPTEVQTRLSALLRQIETSYALTSRIQQLSLLNFL